MSTKRASDRQGTLPLATARRAAARVLGRLAADPSALRLAATGALRRMAPRLVGIDILATAHDPAALVATFRALPFVDQELGHDDEGAAVRLDDGVEVSFAALDDDDARFAGMLLASTASLAHLLALRERAASLGLTLGLAGLQEGPRGLPLHSEEALYERLGLPWFPPELRRDGSLTAPPVDLLAMHDLRGLAHVHTTAGAGEHGLVAMAARVRREGFSWMMLADRGLDAAAVARQKEQIAEARAVAESEGQPFDVLHGAEARIAADGALELGTAALAGLDLVCAAPGEDPVAAAAALSHPAVKVLCHPRTRRSRAWGSDLEAWLPVMDAARAHDVALEISGNPRALPLPEGWDEAARERGLRVLPAADARDLAGVEDVICAVGACRRGRWERAEVLAALRADDARAWLQVGGR